MNAAQITKLWTPEMICLAFKSDWLVLRRVFVPLKNANPCSSALTLAASMSEKSNIDRRYAYPTTSPPPIPERLDPPKKDSREDTNSISCTRMYPLLSLYMLLGLGYSNGWTRNNWLATAGFFFFGGGGEGGS